MKRRYYYILPTKKKQLKEVTGFKVTQIVDNRTCILTQEFAFIKFVQYLLYTILILNQELQRNIPSQRAQITLYIFFFFTCSGQKVIDLKLTTFFN